LAWVGEPPSSEPDLAELANTADLVPDDIDAVSIVPTLLGNATDEEQHEDLYRGWDRGGFQRAVRHGRWKLVSAEDGEWQVFDLETDISESRDIASQRPGLIADAEEWIRANRTEPDQ